MNTSERYMNHCLDLALKGLGNVAPNPMVGCVIVKADKIIAEGYHHKFGAYHAEVNAINSLPSNYNFADCTLYVNLEPCSHHGKTPPCTDLIISKKIKKVVICSQDPNPLVCGNGIKKLQSAGVEVITGVLEKEGRELNRRFFTFHEKKRPYVILKWAQTSNGLISRFPLSDKREDNWITCDESNKLVHLWRSQESAIMVGTNTIIYDNPELTVRHVHGKNPVRVIIDRNLRLDKKHKVFNSAAPTLVFYRGKTRIDDNVHFVKLNESKEQLHNIMEELFKLNISSLFVEGGAKLLHSFLKLNLWDEARIFINPHLEFRNGIKAPEIQLPTDYQLIGSDQLFFLKNGH